MTLNSEQNKAVRHIDGPLLILAGAGSGKTATMTHRMAYMIEQGIDPRSILAVTFTNKAAGEMRSRVTDLVGEVYGMWIMTFHAMCLRMLRYSGEALGYRPGFTVYDETDKKALIKRICKELGVELEIQQMDFESVLPGVQAGKFDLGVSGITANEERKKNALFTDPYCLAAQAIVVTESGSIKSKADLKGKAVAVQTGTTAESFCMAEGYKVNSYAANSDAELSLVNGKVDAWVIDDLTAAEMVASYNESHDDKLVILSEAMTTEPYGFATKLGNDELIGEINKILKKLLDDGTIASVFEKFEAPYTKP